MAEKNKSTARGSMKKGLSKVKPQPRDDMDIDRLLGGVSSMGDTPRNRGGRFNTQPLGTNRQVGDDLYFEPITDMDGKPKTKGRMRKGEQKIEPRPKDITRMKKGGKVRGCGLARRKRG